MIINQLWSNVEVSNEVDIPKILTELTQKVREQDNKLWPKNHSICFNSLKGIYVVTVLFEESSH